jgi:hypothetical protein
MPMPTVVHYCQGSRTGDSFQGSRTGDFAFQKRRVPLDIFSCAHPLFMEVPSDIGQEVYKGKKVVHGPAGKSVRVTKRYTMMLCTVYSAFNAALIDYKQRMCADDPNTNYAKTFKL